MAKILIFIVTYNAQTHIAAVLDRIPRHFLQDAEILLIDDASADDTVQVASKHAAATGLRITFQKNKINQGYGGNQKLGYRYAIQHGFEIVVLLHGDGQYAPEYLPQVTAPIREGAADIVLGSRMLRKRSALEGGMPLYKFMGNIMLTWAQNLLLGTQLAEFHTGYRAWRVSCLAMLPFEHNADNFSFDTDILIQCIDNGFRIKEIDIPTFYGDEISHVNATFYGLQILYTTMLSLLQKRGWVYTSKFDYTPHEKARRI